MARKGSTLTADNVSTTVSQGARRAATLARGVGQSMAGPATRVGLAAGAGAAAKLTGSANRLTGRGGMTTRAGKLGFKAGRKVGRAETQVKHQVKHQVSARPVRNGVIAAGALAGLAAAGAYAVRRRRNQNELADLSEAASVPVTVVETAP